MPPTYATPSSAVVVAAVLVLSLHTAASAQNAPWIDVHSHLVAANSSGKGGQNTSTTEGLAAAAEVAIRGMNGAGTRTAIAMPTPQPAGTFPEANLAAAIKRFPGRLFYMGGGGSLSPMIIAEPNATSVDAATLQRFTAAAESILANGAVGFGEMTAEHLSHNPLHSYHRARPDHPLFLALADIAARRSVVIDFHMDPVVTETEPQYTPSPKNPRRLMPNVPGFERLLAHNRDARIVWAHAGWDQTGQWTVELSRRMLAAHPNLFMSLAAVRAPEGQVRNYVLSSNGGIVREWLALLQEFPDRFVIGSDRFYGEEGGSSTSSAAALFATKSVPRTNMTRALVNQLPPELARKIGIDNAERIYRLPPQK